MNRDLINEHYHGDPADPLTERARERIHWICSQATGKDILDVGCSQGIVCLILGREGFHCTGVDIEPASLAVGQHALANEDEVIRQRVTFQVADASQLPFPDESFDVVVLGEIIEHLVHPERVLIEARRVLRKMGRLVLTVPYGLNAFPDHKSTYYPVSLLQVLQPHFKTASIGTLGEYITYTGIKDPSYLPAQLSKEALFDQYLSLEKLLEKRCLAKERALLEKATELYGQIKKLSAQSTAQAGTLTEIEKNLALRVEQIRKLETALEEGRAEILDSRTEAVRAQTESAAQASRARELQQTLGERDEKIRDLEATVEQQRHFTMELTESLVRAEAQTTIEADKAKRLTETLGLKDEQIASLQGAVEQHRASMTGLAERVGRAEAEAATHAHKAADLRETLVSREEQIHSLQNAAEQQRASITALGERLGRAEAESNAQANKAKNLQDTLTARDDRIRELETALEQTRVAMAGLRESTIRAEAESAAQGSKIRELERAVAAKDALLREFEQTLRQERDSAAVLRKENMEAESARARVNAEAATAKGAVKALELRVSTLETENQQLKNSLETANTALQAANTAQKEQLARIESMQAALLRPPNRPQADAASQVEAEWKRKLANQRVREVVRLAVPPGARVLVISKGDDDLLNLDGRSGLHFPQGEGGVYAGYHPADSAEAIKHFEALKAKADFLLVPASSFWWLDFYQDFRRHLETQHTVVAYDEDCLIFALRQSPGSHNRLKVSVQGLAGSVPKAPGTAKGNGSSKASAPPPATTQSTRASLATAAPSAAKPPAVEAKASGSPTAPALAGAPAPVGATATPAASPAPVSRASLASVPTASARKAERSTLTVGCILDAFTEACFRPECNLVTFRPDNWKTTLERTHIDMLFVESAWNGNGGSWQYKIASFQRSMGEEIVDVVNYCRARNIPTVFWNKEDPPHFDRFIQRAPLFDFVFTSDADMIPKYRAAVNHDRVAALPFAAQPVIHNPIHREPRSGQVCFAGTYYGDRHEERQADMECILRPAIRFGLEIYDRQHGMTGKGAQAYRFPDIYQPCIKGRLDYEEMVKAYKRYRVFLNVNSVKHSPTMFSRRVFELLACGTPVISTYSRGIEEILGPNVVFMTASESDTIRHLEHLLGNEDAWARASVHGMRKVMREHTYRERFRRICEAVGFQRELSKGPHISVIVRVPPRSNLSQLGSALAAQTYRNLDVVLLSEAPLGKRAIEPLRNKVPDFPIATFVGAPTDQFQACLQAFPAEFLSFLDIRDAYGPNYFMDQVLALAYSSADFVGKHTFYTGTTDLELVLRQPGHEFQQVASVQSGTVAARKAALTEKLFAAALSSRVFRTGNSNILALDRFNYIQSLAGAGAGGNRASGSSKCLEKACA